MEKFESAIIFFGTFLRLVINEANTVCNIRRLRERKLMRERPR
jgi:hypothetical protein